MTVTTTKNEAQLFHWGVIIFWHKPTAPWHAFLILARYLQLSWQKIDSCNLLAVQLVTSQVLCHWHKNKSSGQGQHHMLDLPTVSGNMTAATPCVCFMLYGAALLCSRIIPNDRRSCLCQPTNSLMQSALCVTTNVHSLCWVSKYEYNADNSCSREYRCHILPAYWHTYILLLSMKVDVSNALKLIFRKIVSPCLTMSPWIQGTHLFLL